VDKGIGAAFRKANFISGMAEFRRYPCRCTKCGRRRNLSKQPSEYTRRTPRCPGGCRITNAEGQRVPALLRIDWYRMAREWKVERPCVCGMWYSFPHARGRGWCEHNPKITAEDLQDLYENRCVAR
jgi:hypothetical protein